MDYLASTILKRLERMMESQKQPAIKQRLLIIWHKKNGESHRSIGRMLRMPQSTVNDYVQRFRRYGINGLQRKPGSGGNNRYLSKYQERELAGKLEEHPMTTKETLVYIKEMYGKQYHPNSIQRFLRRIGQSLITARPRHYKANPRSGWAFKGHIKKAG